MKSGILLSGGAGTRLQPLTHVVNKHLLGVNGKFIIDYPINTLKQMGVENLTVVLGGNHFSQIVDHLKDGSSIGMKINYVYQGEAKGIAQAINLCENYVSNEDEFAVILGDNIFDGPVKFTSSTTSAQIIVKKVDDPERFGIILRDCTGIHDIIEKPKFVDSSYSCLAITGCYQFNRQFFSYFKELKPSIRGEYEIVDILKCYHRENSLIDRMFYHMWSDAGTHESIARINNYFYNNNHSA